MKTSPQQTKTLRQSAAREVPNVIALVAVVGLMALAACHTTAGAGKDITAAGNAITNSAVQNTPN